MKANSVGVEPLYTLAEKLLDGGLPLDIVDLETGEKAEARTDKAVIHALIQAYGDGDLVLPLGGDSGLVALEVDEAIGGTESVRALMQKVQIPKTVIVRPADGPIYILMRFDGETPITRKVLGSGLALVANDICLVVPPMDEPDGSKGWWKNFSTNAEIASVPAKLAALL